MSRLGKVPVVVPQGVKVSLEGRLLAVQGPLGRLAQPVPELVTIELGDGHFLVKRTSDSRRARTMQGLMRSLAVNLVRGVTSGFEKILEITGVGYRAEVKGNNLSLHLGYSHPVVFPIPEGIKITVDRQTRLTIRGLDKQQVGQVAAKLKSLRLPDAYKGKGIKYAEERLRLKAGKAGMK